ncbi:MAG: DinB family protein [Bacteroidota bacterium]
MKKSLTFLFFTLLTVVCAVRVQAQGINADTVKAQLVKDWERAKSYTAEYLNTMPADKYGARAVDSIRSFAEQMLHLATGTIGLVANGTGAPRIFTGFNMEKSAGAQSKDSVTYYVNASYDYAINSIKAMDANKLGEHVKRGSFDETKLTWLLKAFEHQTHHRGQCTIYIRLQGIRPPNERLF